ncbi:MAG: hypothetical protein QOJ07_176, partial [Thermoleophilaceae bacterium]|nr:hypothetical protein [Thermoleophilaceae bacterium]
MPARVSSVDFVGRARELGVLDAALQRADEGHSGAVLVGGDAGIGKSRLIAEFERRARERGASVLVGECVDLAGGELPYGPIVAALRPLVTSGAAGPLEALHPTARVTLARLWPELAVDGAAGGEPAEFGQGQLFEAIHRLLASASAERPIALVIEDLHWADRSTRDLLAFLIRNSRGQRIVFIATYRSDELHRRHPLRPFVAELERSGGAERIELGPLGPADIGAQLAGILGEQPDSGLAARLAERSEGNPFYAEELLAAADEGLLPESLRDALLMRVERLAPEARDVLALAATAGRSVGHPLLAAATALTGPELGGALREAVAHRLLVTGAGDGDYAFRHALMREAVYADLLPGERVELHGRLAEAITAEPSLAGTGSAVAELAHHWYAAGDSARSLNASLQAATEAEGVHAYAEAQLHLERALELWSRVRDDERPATAQIEVLQRAALAAYLAGELRRAIALERTVLDGIDPAADPVASALSHERLGRYLWASGAGDDATSHYERAIELVPPDPPSQERARALAAHAHVLMLAGRLTESTRLAEEARDMARLSGARLVEVSAVNTLGAASSSSEVPDRGLEAMRSARLIAEELGAVDEVGRSYINESHALEELGRLRESVETSVRGIERADRLGAARVWGAFLRGDLALRLFRLGEWDRAVAEADEVLRALPTPLNEASALTVLGRIAAERGEFDEAARHIERSLALSRTSGGPMWAGPNHAALGALELWRGDLPAAHAALGRGVEEVGDLEMPSVTAEVDSLHARAQVDRALRARLLGETAAADAAEAAARAALVRLEAVAPAASLPEARAEIEVNRAELTRLEDHPAAPWLAIAETWIELAQPYRAALAQWRAAEALIAAGERGSD